MRCHQDSGALIPVCNFLHLAARAKVQPTKKILGFEGEALSPAAQDVHEPRRLPARSTQLSSGSELRVVESLSCPEMALYTGLVLAGQSHPGVLSYLPVVVAVLTLPAPGCCSYVGQVLLVALVPGPVLRLMAAPAGGAARIGATYSATKPGC